MNVRMYRLIDLWIWLIWQILEVAPAMVNFHQQTQGHITNDTHKNRGSAVKRNGMYPPLIMARQKHMEM